MSGQKDANSCGFSHSYWQERCEGWKDKSSESASVRASYKGSAVVINKQPQPHKKRHEVKKQQPWLWGLGVHACQQHKLSWKIHPSLPTCSNLHDTLQTCSKTLFWKLFVTSQRAQIPLEGKCQHCWLGVGSAPWDHFVLANVRRVKVLNVTLHKNWAKSLKFQEVHPGDTYCKI